MSSDIRPLGEILDTRQRWLLIVSLMLAMFVGALDQTIVATATPKILADLGGFGLLSWMFTSYMLASTVVIPLVGKLSDVYGRKVFVMVGIIVFMIGSGLCGAAPTMISLILFRALQGIGGGMIFSSVFSTIGDIFPPAERGKYMGMFTGTFSLASILGPTVGGFLTDSVDWRLVFYINVPFALIALPAIWFNLSNRRGARKPKIDFVGAAFLSLAIREPSPIVERVEIVVRELGLVLLGVRQLHTRHGCHQALKELVGHALASFTGLLAVAEQNKVLDDLLQAATCIGCQ